MFIRGAENIKNLRIAGLKDVKDRTAVISLDFSDKDNAEIAYHLDKHFGIKTRCGLHCAPSAHKTLDTFPQGTVRFSLSHFNTEEEIEYALTAISQTLKEI